MMHRAISRRRQRGATLIVGLIMLALITVMVTSSFSMSTTNLKAVGNAQFRGEALVAANHALEQMLSSPFTDAPAAEEIEVDINSDGNSDYIVQIAAPTCISATSMPSAAAPPSSAALGAAFAAAAATEYQTVWDLGATVSDAATDTGATVEVHQGVRVLLTEAEYTAVCT